MTTFVCRFPVVNPEDVPRHWPDERFELIWVLVRETGATPAFRFVAVPQMLLANDEEST